MKGTKEFYEIMNQFEKDAKNLFYGHKVERVGRDDDAPADQFYNDGFVNRMFHAYMLGYQFYKSIANLERLEQLEELDHLRWVKQDYERMQQVVREMRGNSANVESETDYDGLGSSYAMDDLP